MLRQYRQSELLQRLDRRVGSRPFSYYSAHARNPGASDLDAIDHRLQGEMLELFPPGFWCIAVHLNGADEVFLSQLRDNPIVNHACITSILIQLLQASIQVDQAGINRLIKLFETHPRDQLDIATKISGLLATCRKGNLLTPANYWDIIQTVFNASHDSRQPDGLMNCNISEAICKLQELGLLSTIRFDEILEAYQQRRLAVIDNINAIPDIFGSLGIQAIDLVRTDAPDCKTFLRLRDCRVIVNALDPVLLSDGRCIAQHLNFLYSGCSDDRLYDGDVLKILHPIRLRSPNVQSMASTFDTQIKLTQIPATLYSAARAAAANRNAVVAPPDQISHDPSPSIT
jgi:hypothetical protein